MSTNCPGISRALVLVAAAVAALYSGASVVDADQAVKEITVDCTRNKSIQDAIDASPQADLLILNVIGRCTETVELRRSRVTIRGNDPAVDGIVFPSTLPPDPQRDDTTEPTGAALSVWNASAIRLENITISGGEQPGMGSALWLSSCEVEAHGCVFESGEPARRGLEPFGSYNVYVGQSATLTAYGSRFHIDDGKSVVVNGGALLADAGVITGVVGIEAYAGARVWLLPGSRVEASLPMRAQVGTNIQVNESDVISTGRYGMMVAHTAVVDMYDGLLQGSMYIAYDGSVLLQGVEQVPADPDRHFNFVDSGSLLAVERFLGDSGIVESSLTGPVYVDSFSHLVLRNTTFVQGDVICSSGGDSVAQGPVTVSGAIRDCAHLP